MGVWGPASSLLQTAVCPSHTFVLCGVHFRSADTPCMHVAVLRLHAGTACTSTHTMRACSCLTGALHVGSSCLMQVLSHLAHTLHAHSCPTYTLIHCTPHPTALPVPCLRIPLLRDTLHEAEQVNIYVCVCVYIMAALYIARNVGSFCGRSLSGTASSWWIICGYFRWLSNLGRAGDPLEGPGGAGDGGRCLSSALLCTI